MKELAEYKKYHVITIPELAGVNCIYANNTLIHCSPDELMKSAKVFASKVDYPRIELKNREFCKVDRLLACRCLLFTKKRIYSILAASSVPKSSELIPMSYTTTATATKPTTSNGQHEIAKNEERRIIDNMETASTAAAAVAAAAANLKLK